MFCSYCGNQISEGARFCSYCGKEVVRIISVQPTAEQPADKPNSAVQPEENIELSEPLTEDRSEQTAAAEEKSEQPVEQAVEQPVEQTDEQIERAVEQPTESLVEKRLSTDITEQTDELAKRSFDLENDFSAAAPNRNEEFVIRQTQTSEQPTEQAYEQPVEQPFEQSVEQAAEQPIENPVESPIDNPVEQLLLAHTPEQTPPAPQKQEPERKYTLTHLLMCLASTAVFAIAAGVFAGLYFSAI